MIIIFEALQTRLRELSAKLNLDYSDVDWQHLTDQSLTASNLKSNDVVPLWLVDFLQRLLDAEAIEPVCFKRLGDETNLERRWLGYIESMIGGEWEFDGESESVAFDKIGVQGFIEYEGNTYYTITY